MTAWLGFLPPLPHGHGSDGLDPSDDFEGVEAALRATMGKKLAEVVGWALAFEPASVCELRFQQANSGFSRFFRNNKWLLG